MNSAISKYKKVPMLGLAGDRPPKQQLSRLFLWKEDDQNWFGLLAADHALSNDGISVKYTEVLR